MYFQGITTVGRGVASSIVVSLTAFVMLLAIPTDTTAQYGDPNAEAPAGKSPAPQNRRNNGRGVTLGVGAGLGAIAPADPMALENVDNAPPRPRANRVPGMPSGGVDAPRSQQPDVPGAPANKQAQAKPKSFVIPGQYLPFTEKVLNDITQQAVAAKAGADYAQLASLLNIRRELIKTLKTEADNAGSDLLSQWADDEQVIANADAKVRKGQYQQAVDILQPRWLQRQSASPLNGDLGMALLRASLCAVVIDDKPILSRQQMQKTLDDILAGDPMQVEAVVVRAWMIDADPENEFLRLESRSSIIQRNQLLLPMQQSLQADLGMTDNSVVAGDPTFADGPRQMTRSPGRLGPGQSQQAQWSASKAGMPESMSRFLLSVTSYSLGISRNPVFEEMKRCQEFFGRNVLQMTDRDANEYCLLNGQLWQRWQNMGRPQWRLLDKPLNKPWQGYSLYVFRWNGQDVQATAGASGQTNADLGGRNSSYGAMPGRAAARLPVRGDSSQESPQETGNLYDLLRDKEPMEKGSLGQIGEYCLAIYDSSDVLTKDLEAMVILKGQVSVFKSAWKRQSSSLDNKVDEGKYLIFPETQMERMETIQGQITYDTSGKVTLIPLFGVLEKEKKEDTVKVSFFVDDKGAKFLLDDNQQKIYFTDSDILEIHTPGFKPGKPYKGRLLRPMWFSHFSNDLSDAGRLLKWARRSSDARASKMLGPLIKDVEKSGQRGKSIDDLLFDAVFRDKTVIAVDRSQNQYQAIWDYQDHVRDAKQFFVSASYGFDPRARLLIWQDQNQGKTISRPIPGRNNPYGTGQPGQPASKNDGEFTFTGSLVFLDENGEVVPNQFYESAELADLRTGQIMDFMTPSYEAIPNPLIGLDGPPPGKQQTAAGGIYGSEPVKDPTKPDDSTWLGFMFITAHKALMAGDLHLAATMLREMPPMEVTFPRVTTAQTPGSDDIKLMVAGMEQAILSAMMKLQAKLVFAGILDEMGRTSQANEMRWGAKASWTLAVEPLLEELTRFATSYGYSVSEQFLKVRNQVTTSFASIPAASASQNEGSKGFMADLLAGIKAMGQNPTSSTTAKNVGGKFEPEKLADLLQADSQLDKWFADFYSGKPAESEYIKAKQWLRQNRPELLLRNPANEFESMLFGYKPLIYANGTIERLRHFAEPSDGIASQWNGVLYAVETEQYSLARIRLLELAYHQRDAAKNYAPESLDYLIPSVNAIAMLWLATGSESFLYGPVRFGTDFAEVTINELEDFIKRRMYVLLPQNDVNSYLQPIYNIRNTTNRLLTSDKYLSERFFWFEYTQLADGQYNPSKAADVAELPARLTLPATTAAQPAESDESKAQPASESTVQAQQMLEQADKMKKIRLYSKALDICDDILARWPGSAEAEKSQLLIKSILQLQPQLTSQRQQAGKWTQ